MHSKTETVTLPLTVFEFTKVELEGRTIDDIVRHFRGQIDAHTCARFVGIFNHFAHTCGLPDGEIAPGIEDARNVVFCFGMAIPDPTALATRPRSIGICELSDRYVISFLEAPMPLANAAIEAWVQALSEPPDRLPGPPAGFGGGADCGSRAQSAQR